MKYASIILALVASASSISIRDNTAGGWFKVQDIGTGTLDKKYERVIPARFADGADDLFMRSMIMNYAREGKNADGSPNGKFFLSEKECRAAASEVLETHKGLKGASKAEYLATYFPRTFAHFDVNKDGYLGVEVLP